MMAWNGSIKSQYLGGETLLVDLGRSLLVSDHPPQLGGSGKGPLPGDLMKGALISSILLALGEAADRGELPIESCAARCSSPLAYSDTNGPLARIVYVTQFDVDLVVVGELDSAQLSLIDKIARECSVAKALAGNLDLKENNQFLAVEAWHTNTKDLELLMETRGHLSLDRDEDAVSPAKAGAEYLGAGRVMLTWGSSAHLVESANSVGSGSAPEELLMASLAACTTVFVGRAARAAGASVDIRVVCEGEFNAENGAPGRISKQLEIRGELNQSQREEIAFYADHCALGETLGRCSTININVQHIPSQAAAGVSVSGAKSALSFIQDSACEDGFCCVPS